MPLPIPKPGEVLVKVTAAAVNPSDMGDIGQAAKGLPVGSKLPRVFGREGAGVAVEGGTCYQAAVLEVEGEEEHRVRGGDFLLVRPDREEDR